MELNPEQLEKVDPLALSNTITISALVGLLIRKGLFNAEELTEEIRVMRARIAADKRSAHSAGAGAGDPDDDGPDDGPDGGLD